MLKSHSRELAVAAAILALLLVLAWKAPGFFTFENFNDIALANLPVMIIALGMTVVVLTANIDISVGSTFAVCSVLMGAVAKSELHVIDGLVAVTAGLICGALNGAFVAYLRIPSIVATLATMVALRDGLRWITQGSWIGGLPQNFQWFALTQSSYVALVFSAVILLVIFCILGLRYLRVGRSVYATGSNAAAAEIMGIRTERVIFFTFVLLGGLTGLASVLNAVRFKQIPSNAGLGLEMQVIAAVAVGGAVFTGGAGTIVGTVLGVILLAIVGPALTFFGVSSYWEKALQGGIILAAIALNTLGKQVRSHGKVRAVAAA